MLVHAADTCCRAAAGPAALLRPDPSAARIAAHLAWATAAAAAGASMATAIF